MLSFRCIYTVLTSRRHQQRFKRIETESFCVAIGSVDSNYSLVNKLYIHTIYFANNMRLNKTFRLKSKAHEKQMQLY